MAIVQAELFAEIAQLLEGTKEPVLYRHPLHDVFPALSSLGEDLSGVTFVPWLDGWKKAFAETGLDYTSFVQDPDGSQVAQDVYGLKQLIESGDIDPDEAIGFINKKYGGALDVSGLVFADVAAGADVAIALAAEQALSEDPTKAELEEAALASLGTLGPGATSTAAYGPVTLYVPHVPEGPLTGRDARAALDDLVAQVALQLNAVRSGEINFRANSLDGRFIKPGSISPSKVDPITFYRAFTQWPGPDDTIVVNIARDNSRDRWVEANGYTVPNSGLVNPKGPGRVWRVQSWRPVSSAYRPTPGPVRYRIVTRDLEFGLCSIRKSDDGNAYGSVATKYIFKYGLVLRGLPLFYDRPPQAIAHVAWEGDVPVGLTAQFKDTAGVGGSIAMYHTRAEAEFVSTPRFGFEPYGRIASGQFIPPQASVDDIQGIDVSLLSGNRATEVYEQLNGLSTGLGQLAGDPVGPGITAPSGRRIESLAVPTVVTVSALGNFGGGVTMVTEAGAPNLNSLNIIQGIPFQFPDAAVLAPKPSPHSVGSFSVLIAPIMDVEVTVAEFEAMQSSATNDMSPALWWASGVRVVEQNNREIALDLVVV